MAAGEGEERRFYCPRLPGAEAATLDGGAEGAPVGAPGLARYRLFEERGRGGFAVVYRGLDLARDRQVAVKVLGAAPSPALAARFEREAATLSSFDDPGIVPVLDAGRTETGLAFLVMPLVDGPTLEAVLVDGGAQPAAEAARVVAVLARTLSRLHARGLRHRDVKPSNVLLTPDGTPLLSDFGVALDLQDAQRLTHDGHPPGTPAYMAPELFDAPSEPDWALADVYALGLVLAETLLGERPRGRLGGRTADGGRWLDRLGGQVEPSLAAICERAAHPDPARRYPDAAAFAEALERWSSSSPPRAEVPRAAPARQPDPARPHRRRWALAAGLAAVAVGAAWWATREAGRDEADAREALARRRLEAVWLRREQLRADGREEEAAATLDAFVGLGAHQGTEALAEAWLRRGEELREGPPDEAATAFTRALFGSRASRTRAAGAIGLADALRRGGRWAELAALGAELAHDPALSAVWTPELQAQGALGQRRMADALAALSPDDPRRAFLEHVRFGRRDPSPPPPETPRCGSRDLLTLTSVDGALVASSAGYDRSLFLLDPDTCERTPLDPATDALDSWTQALAPLDLDGDGQDELALGMGPPAAYGVRVLRFADGSVTAPVELLRLGNVVGLMPWRGADAAPRLVAVTSPNHPSRDAFPEGTPPASVVELRWAEGAFVVERSAPLPAMGGRPMIPRAGATADLDGDGDEDVVVGLMGAAGGDATLALIQDAGHLQPALLGGVFLTGTTQADDDPAAELVGRIGDAWTLGAGDVPIDADLPPAPPRGARDEEPGWIVASRLARFGLTGAAEDELALLGRTREGAEAAEAWSAVAALRAQQLDPRGAAVAWSEAARLGRPGAWAEAAAAHDQHFDRAEADAARAHVPGAPPPEGATARSLLAPRPAAWTVRGPFARTRPDGALLIDAAAGTGTVARLGLARAPGRLGFVVRGAVEVQEWGHRLTFRLAPEGGEEELAVFLQSSGGGGDYTRDVGSSGDPWIVTPDRPPGRPRAFELVVGESTTPGWWRVSVAWDGAHAGAYETRVQLPVDAARWTLDVRSDHRAVDGVVGRVRIDALDVHGLVLAEAGPPLAPPSALEEAAALLGAIRREPATTSEQLARERGPDAALDLLAAAFGAAAAHPTSADPAAALRTVPLFAHPSLPRRHPQLAALRGLALLEEGDTEAARRAFTAVAEADREGPGCVMARAALATLAGAPTPYDPAGCDTPTVRAELWTRRAGLLR